ncbi:MAG: metallophosphoesterase [Sulfobacillus thermosulfidooxidans]|nr:MAG: metallophosphoesterase [Sulfobacillus thermosulfidooxidans]
MLNAAVLGLFGVAFYAVGIEPFWIREVCYDLVVRNLAKEFDGFTILHLSDFHGRVGAFSFLRHHPIRADMVAVTGDLYAWRTLPRARLVREINGLTAPEGVFYVSGNHDYHRGRLDVTPWNPGPRLLDNRVHRIKRGEHSLWVAGIPDLVKGQPAWERVLGQLAQSTEPAILLSHRPDAWLLPGIERFALVLAGHTHGGQVTAFGRWVPVRHTRVKKPYAGGLITADSKPPLITSRGLGASELPVRFGSRPEVVKITLHSDVVAHKAVE